MSVAVMALPMVGLVACGSESAPESPWSRQLAISTHGPPPLDEALRVCAAARLEGVVIVHERSGLGVRTPDGVEFAVVWPHGHTAWEISGQIVLLDRRHQSVGRVGAPIVLGGGTDERWWYTCN
jgi:hypothetical protein